MQVDKLNHRFAYTQRRELQPPSCHFDRSERSERSGEIQARKRRMVIVQLFLSAADRLDLSARIAPQCLVEMTRRELWCT
ncbi:MAG: hypothetical protein NC184_02580 [Roseburia sp.]|nr:hypothetical protein [Roseburia sp.]